jgi:hypothetical protein
MLTFHLNFTHPLIEDNKPLRVLILKNQTLFQLLNCQGLRYTMISNFNKEAEQSAKITAILKTGMRLDFEN